MPDSKPRSRRSPRGLRPADAAARKAADDLATVQSELAAAGCFDPPPLHRRPRLHPRQRRWSATVTPRGRVGTGRARCPTGCGGRSMRGRARNFTGLDSITDAFGPLSNGGCDEGEAVRLGARIRKEGLAQARSERHARDKVSPSMGLGSVCTCSDFNEGKQIGPRARS
ncbi:hypothetical protein CBM2625_U10001 [Cupriavidus taiwanensis]|uniref:Uncharacterized protein n=1 Tax=Cupriavidus taiwanensis TaxID=164546 RepID=A0A375HAJ7_9BURK|nr:hypothetical protein CBM2625_U10001 [Cupriavidus taiwanensis]SPD49011.1 protein of unknown function [Cupriavidus taiwanensis]